MNALKLLAHLFSKRAFENGFALHTLTHLLHTIRFPEQEIFNISTKKDFHEKYCDLANHNLKTLLCVASKYNLAKNNYSHKLGKHCKVYAHTSQQ